MSLFTHLQQTLPSFLERIFLFIEELGIDVAELEIDHIAARYKNPQDVAQLAEELKAQGKVLADTIVNGRTIYIFKLQQPLQYQQRHIPCVELPYPAANHRYPHDGWEHVEFVLPTPEIVDLATVFTTKFPQLTPEKLQQYHYALSIPQVEGEQLANPSISLTKHPGLTIKFHSNSIEQVVTS